MHVINYFSPNGLGIFELSVSTALVVISATAIFLYIIYILFRPLNRIRVTIESLLMKSFELISSLTALSTTSSRTYVILVTKSIQDWINMVEPVAK